MATQDCSFDAAQLAERFQDDLVYDVGWAVDSAGDPRKGVVQALIELLDYKDTQVCRNAARALGRIGPQASGA